MNSEWSVDDIERIGVQAYYYSVFATELFVGHKGPNSCDEFNEEAVDQR